MPDNLTPAQRSYCMSRVKGKNTSLEMTVRSALYRRGLRFRLHARDLPGKPDIVFRAARVAVFVDGDYWHGWRFPCWKNTLSAFWREKILKNRERDARNFRKLRRMGWRVIRLWEHDVKRDLGEVLAKVAASVRVDG